MQTAWVKPAPGLKVRDPQTRIHLPSEGAEVTLDGKAGTYWRKRIAAGDVVVVNPTPPKTSGKGGKS